MSNLPPETPEVKTPLKKDSTIWAVVIGLFTTALVYWILDQQSSGFRIGAAIAGGVVVAIAMYRKSVKSGLKSDAQDGDKTK